MKVREKEEERREWAKDVEKEVEYDELRNQLKMLGRPKYVAYL